MNKCEFSTPSVVLMAIGALVLLWLIGKLLGASFFFLAAVVIAFLILLITYCVIRLHDEPLLEKIKKCLGMSEPEKEEDK
jgi:O-antigen ligase